MALIASLILESGLESATRFSFRFLIDEAVLPKNYGRLIELLALLGCGALLFGAIALVADYTWAKLGAKVVSDLRAALYLHIESLSLDFFQRRRSGDILTCLVSDADAVESCLVTVAPYGLLGVTGIVMTTGLMASIQPAMAAATFVGTVICFVLPRTLLGKANRASLAMRRQEGAMASTIQETLQSQYLIKAFGLERELYRRFCKTTVALVDLSVKANFLSYAVERIPAISFFMLCLAIIGGSAVLAFHGQMSIGSVVSFQVLALGLGSAIGNLTWLTPVVVEATAAMERINEIFREVPTLKDNPGAPAPPPFSTAIRFEQVSFAYPPSGTGLVATPAVSRPFILNNLTLELVNGQFTVIVGSSGSGKTTLLQMLLRLYDPTSGAVLFDGVDLRDLDTTAVRCQMGFVAQDSLLFDSTIRDNVRMGKLDATDEEVLAAMTAAECAHLIRKLDKGLEAIVGEKGAQLSGGERQRIALARALIRKPQILILDEGTSALDSRSEARLLVTLRGLAAQQKITVIAVTHRLRMAPLADKVVVIRDGSVEADGPHTELLAQQGSYASLWQQSTT